MYLPFNASKRRIREAENARANRLEIVKALSIGEITRRDLFRWGLFTTTGALALKHGLSPYATSAYAQVPTGTNPSPLGAATKWSQKLPRPIVPTKHRLQREVDGSASWRNPDGTQSAEARNAQRLSYHQNFNDAGGNSNPSNPFRNPVTNAGPCEGRPDREIFAHQRWDQVDAGTTNATLFPKAGYILSIGQIKAGQKFHAGMAEQQANKVWCFGDRTPGMAGAVGGSRTGNAVPTLIKLRYGEPVVTRIYNDLPVARADNGDFGRNECSTHFHNAHNGAESDGACNAFHFPGTFYDYHWGTTMARRDMPQMWLTGDPKYQDKCSGPDDANGLVRVPGDFREIQGTLWFHDHRFFFTAENVHKGMFALCNMYSGPDRGREDLADGINLRLPSGSFKPWGNTDFDVNLAISNPALSADGQLFFDIFDTEGFLGDMLLVNGAYYPELEVLPRRYRFRILNASMSRFVKLGVIVDRAARYARGTPVPFHFIANDGNLVVKPLTLTMLDEQGPAERYDIVIDFSKFLSGDQVYLTNFLLQTNGRLPTGAVSTAQALAGVTTDPAVGPILRFKVVKSLQSHDDPSITYDFSGASTAAHNKDQSVDLSKPEWATSGPLTLTTQIPIVTPVRERVINFNRSGGDSRVNGVCVPECGDIAAFPWGVQVNGQGSHSLNATRVSAVVPQPGDVEHWTLVNVSANWDHPIHMHFEEGVTIDRGTATIPSTERLVRKDVWRLRPNGRVKYQVRFGEFGGAYVAHCHNTVHEDFAMLMRYQLLSAAGTPHATVTDTPNPTPTGVQWLPSEVL